MHSSAIVYQYKHPIIFYILAILIPWFFWFIAGYISHIGYYQQNYPNLASILAFAGLLAPVMVCYFLVIKEPELKKDIFKRFFNLGEISPIYLILACIIMPASIICAQLISLLFGYSSEQFIISGNFSFSSGIFPVWSLLIVAPILEEMAWHSYGTDCLRRKYSLFTTSILFGVFWGIWHMPLAGIHNYYQSNIVETGWIYGVNFLVSIIPFVLLMNWLYYKSERNILVTMIFHITAGLFNELFAPHPDSKIIQTVLLIVLVTVIIVKNKNFFFKK